MISLDECNGSCNAVDDFRKYVLSKTKDVTVKVFYIITKIHDALIKHISYDCRCKLNSKTCKSNQKWNNDKYHCKCKKYNRFKKNYSWNTSICICRYSKYLKSIADDSITV